MVTGADKRRNVNQHSIYGDPLEATRKGVRNSFCFHEILITVKGQKTPNLVNRSHPICSKTFVWKQIGIYQPWKKNCWRSDRAALQCSAGDDGALIKHHIDERNFQERKDKRPFCCLIGLWTKSLSFWKSPSGGILNSNSFVGRANLNPACCIALFSQVHPNRLNQSRWKIPPWFTPLNKILNSRLTLAVNFQSTAVFLFFSFCFCFCFFFFWQFSVLWLHGHSIENLNVLRLVFGNQYITFTQDFVKHMCMPPKFEAIPFPHSHVHEICIAMWKTPLCVANVSACWKKEQTAEWKGHQCGKGRYTVHTRSSAELVFIYILPLWWTPPPRTALPYDDPPVPPHTVWHWAQFAALSLSLSLRKENQRKLTYMQLIDHLLTGTLNSFDCNSCYLSKVPQEAVAGEVRRTWTETAPVLTDLWEFARWGWTFGKAADTNWNR